MAPEKNDPFENHKVHDSSFLSWDTPGVQVCGIVKAIRTQPGRNQQLAHFVDLAIGRDETGAVKMVACSVPTTLWQKFETADVKPGQGIKITYTGSHKTGSGNSAKDFEFFALPKNMDLKSLPPETWGIKNGKTSDSPPISDDDGEELPF